MTVGRILSIGCMVVLLSMPAMGAQQGAMQQMRTSPTYTLRVNSDLVLTNVIVRDKRTGAVVLGLTSKDFRVEENSKPQRIIGFDFETVDQAAALQEHTITGQAGTGSSHSLFEAQPGVASPEDLHDRRLVVLFFDLTSMQPDDIERAQDAARSFIEHQMSPADLVAVTSLDTDLSLDQDFTADKQLLLKAVNSYSSGAGSGFASGATSTTNQVEDTTSFTPDEGEYNDLNTDRELFSIEEIAKSLAYIHEKKALVYFSGGIQRDGIENQASLHAAVNAAVRGNMSIYSIDARGLQAISPLGDATTGSLRGNAAYTGGAIQNNFDSNFNTQEVMATLSSDTGGRAFFDSNDFAPAFTQMEKDTSAYYVIGFRSTDTRRDGRYRRLKIEVDRKGVKLEYRPGYYAPADFKHATHEEREQQLEDEMASPLPATDVAVYLQAFYFQIDPTRYYVPVALVVPGSQIPFVKNGDRDKATLDIIGQVKDANGRDLGDVRATVKLKVNAAQQVRSKNVEYTTGFVLPPGTFHLKFVARENETGLMGSFETDIHVPDLRKASLKMSSVVLASQRIAAAKRTESPLIYDGMELVPNLPHVFLRGQHLFLLYEVYDPAHAEDTGGKRVDSALTPVHVLTSIEFLHDGAKVFETPMLQATQINEPARDAVAFQLDVPLTDLEPGLYLCQVNVIDDARGSFMFPRLALLVRAPEIAAKMKYPLPGK